MYSMWGVHQVVTEHQNSLEREAREDRLRRQIQETPMQERDRRTLSSRWGWLTELLAHRHLRRQEAVQP